jgi:hypothetical protein
VVATENGIRLSLACDCRVAVFAIRDAAIAIDIADAVPAEGLVAVEQTSATEAARPTAEEPPSAAGMGADVGPSMPPPQTGAGSPDVVAPAPQSGRDGAPGFAFSSLPSAAPDTAFVTDAPPELRSTTMERLAEGVARAASQGTLRLAPGNSPTEASVVRRHLSSRLIDIFLGAGDTTTADAIRAAVDRAAGPHGDGFDLAAARVDAASQRPNGMRTARDLAQSASPVADEALALHLALGNEDGAPAEQPSLARAEMRANDLRGSETGARLEAELILAALRIDDFELAGSRLAMALAAGQLPAEREDALVADYISALAHRASDETLLVHAAALEDTIMTRATNGSERPALAQRLANLGFARLARAYLPVEEGRVTDVALTAEILILSGDGLGALALLDEVQNPEERHLEVRAAALRSLGRTREAAEIYERLGDWRTAEAVRRIAGLSTEASWKPTGGPDDGATERATTLPDLMEASETARTRIDTMLRDLPEP